MPHSIHKLPFKGKGLVKGCGLLLSKGLGNSYDSLDQYRQIIQTPPTRGGSLSKINSKLEKLMVKPLSEKSKTKNIQF